MISNLMLMAAILKNVRHFDTKSNFDGPISGCVQITSFYNCAKFHDCIIIHFNLSHSALTRARFDGVSRLAVIFQICALRAQGIRYTIAVFCSVKKIKFCIIFIHIFLLTFCSLWNFRHSKLAKTTYQQSTFTTTRVNIE